MPWFIWLFSGKVIWWSLPSQSFCILIVPMDNLLWVPSVCWIKSKLSLTCKHFTISLGAFLVFSPIYPLLSPFSKPTGLFPSSVLLLGHTPCLNWSPLPISQWTSTHPSKPSPKAPFSVKSLLIPISRIHLFCLADPHHCEHSSILTLATLWGNLECLCPPWATLWGPVMSTKHSVWQTVDIIMFVQWGHDGGIDSKQA